MAGLACRVEMATSGSATDVIEEPTALVDSPTHSRREVPCPQQPAHRPLP